MSVALLCARRKGKFLRVQDAQVCGHTPLPGGSCWEMGWISAVEMADGAALGAHEMRVSDTRNLGVWVYASPIKKP